MFKLIKKTHLHTSEHTFDDFIQKNRIRTNNILNNVLWICIVAGPSMALGITLGAFKHIHYQTCIVVSLILLFCAIIHKILCRKYEKSIITSIFALAVIDFVILYLVKNQVGLSLSYFIVPLVSLLFCERKTYHIATLINYVIMIVGVYYESKYKFSYSPTPTLSAFFIDRLFGYSIEQMLLFVIGNFVSKTSTTYIQRLYENQQLLVQNENHMKEQLDILNSMSDIYSHMILIDFNKNQIVSFTHSNTKTEKFYLTKTQHQSELSQLLSQQIVNDQIQSFLDFTNLSTIQERMKDSKLLTAEYISTVTGWLRVQFISIEQDAEMNNVRIIQTIQDIDQEKQREENLKRISNTDQLTHLFNRRAYDDDIREYQSKQIEQDFVLMSIDVNGLKQVNDNLGHQAGDELLQGASFSIQAVFGHIGKIYRVGGDEFLVIVHTTDAFEPLVNQLRKIVNNWHGQIVDSLAMSIGYAKKTDYPGASISDLEKTADELMYKDKEKYYLKKGVDRRGQQLAFDVIAKSYTKILKINLSEDSYSIIKVDEREKTAAFGFSEVLSTWFKNFASKNMIHPDDVEEYLKYTDISYLSEYFETDNRYLRIFLRRKFNSDYRQVILEIFKADNYSLEYPILYLYVKDIDK